MKVTRVQYTVRPEYVAQNKRNIEAVMRELRAIGNDDVKYAVYLQQDGRTFMHFVHQNTTEAERYPTSLESFKVFQGQLSANLEVPPKVEVLTLVDAAAQIF
jgi:hypothetical protein